MRAARELLKDLEYEVLSGSVDINVNELVYNTAKVTKEYFADYGGEGPVLKAVSVEQTRAPKEEIISFM